MRRPERTRQTGTRCGRSEIEENEFNLNIPRYVDTFEPEEPIDVRIVILELEEASKQERQAEERLYLLLHCVGYKA